MWGSLLGLFLVVKAKKNTAHVNTSTCRKNGPPQQDKLNALETNLQSITFMLPLTYDQVFELTAEPSGKGVLCTLKTDFRDHGTKASSMTGDITKAY